MIWPRHHAIKIICIDSVEDRQKYIDNEVPENFTDWVKKYVYMWWKDRDKIRDRENTKC